MSDLISLTFQGKHTADRVLEELAGLQRETEQETKLRAALEQSTKGRKAA